LDQELIPYNIATHLLVGATVFKKA